ncbi:MAG TPA: SIMPL domain-containing protein [Rhizomicrobium sp.]|nr:SIMPL domain-containing protein [Rhizomicrobium sp.]
MRFRIACFAAALLAVGALALPTAADAQAQPARLLTVTGQGEVKGAPNQAQLSAGVVTTAKTAAAALAANTRAMNAVFATLKKAGIADKDMQTSDFSVQPQYASVNAPSGQQRVTGYQVSNTVSVTVENLATLGPTLDALVSSGANSIGEIAFGIKDPRPLLAQARAAAVADAMLRAQTYAKAAGVTLGPITSIGEGGFEAERPMMALGMLKANAAPVPVAAGEQSVTAGVSITWELR